ncbi:MAG: hypothetical protein D3922_00050 [Candidatus Electrothrix sp. AR1]|nr:hypothetical protein [Candidatus Electrothrix sp. AR1]
MIINNGVFQEGTDFTRAKIGRIKIGSSVPLRKRKSIFTSLKNISVLQGKIRGRSDAGYKSRSLVRIQSQHGKKKETGSRAKHAPGK